MINRLIVLTTHKCIWCSDVYVVNTNHEKAYRDMVSHTADCPKYALAYARNLSA